jgi:hypothetical protein
MWILSVVAFWCISYGGTSSSIRNSFFRILAGKKSEIFRCAFFFSLQLGSPGWLLTDGTVPLGAFLLPSSTWSQLFCSLFFQGISDQNKQFTENGKKMPDFYRTPGE